MFRMVGPDQKLMAVPVRAGSTFEPCVATRLFDVPVLSGFVPFAVAPDGRFLPTVVSDAAAARAAPLTVVLDWRPVFP